MRKKFKFDSLALVFVLFVATAESQTTAFTYQGRLTDSSMAANGVYDFQFSLYDAVGNVLTPALSRPNVSVVNGVFTVELNFGSALFSGEERSLQVSVKKPADLEYTILSPRQSIRSSPYSIRARSTAAAEDAAGLGGIAAEHYVQNSDPRMSDSRDPNPGSGNYIQNSATQQASSNFNISGTGRANIFNAVSHYNINGVRAFAITSPDNTFVGFSAGTNTTNGANSFFGSAAGNANTTGGFNSFFGASTGAGNTSGSNNSFFGVQAGESNTSGTNNSFFGRFAGFSNTISGTNSFFGSEAGFTSTGSGNSFFGYRSGFAVTVGTGNSFFGGQAGEQSIGMNNTFLGYRAGRNNQHNGNTFVGFESGLSNTTGNRNTFVGENAGRSTTNGAFNSIFGSWAGQNNTGGFNSFFGANAGGKNVANRNSFFGNSAGFNNTEGTLNSFFGDNAGGDNTTGNRNAFFGSSTGGSNQTGSDNAYFGYGAGTAGTGSSNAFFGANAGQISQGTANTFVGRDAGKNHTSGINNTFIGTGTGEFAGTSNNNTLIGALSGAANNTSFATAIGAGATVGANNTIVLGRSTGVDVVSIPGSLRVSQLGSAGATNLCRNAGNEISTCSSSLRYKSNIESYDSGLQLVRRLQPISFDWKDYGLRDIGLIAEDVAAIEPLLASFNNDGQIEGVKYDRLGVVLLNAIKEQQDHIERQQRQIEEQRGLIDQLRLLVCSIAVNANVCRLEGK